MRKIILILLYLVCQTAIAQFTSNVQGTILDSSGAALPGAVVTITNTGTNISATFTTRESGQYTFNSLPPGLYLMRVAAQGFEQSVRNVTLTTQQTAGVNFQLHVGGSTTTVDVSTEEAHGLNPDETRLQYTLSSREIEEFPLQNRATFSLLRTAPGASGISEGSQNVAVNRQSAAESANGRSNSANIFLLDFIPVNSQLGSFSDSGDQAGGAVLVPQPDMISEIALQTTTFSVENGAGSGIQTSITTKSGSNKFHGDADYTYTGGPFAAIAPLESKSATFRRQYVSTALGGPIWKDRTFFFGSYFNQQVASPNTGTSTYYDPKFIAWAATNYPTSVNISQGLAPFPADRAVNPSVIQTGRAFDGSSNPFNNQSIPCNDAAKPGTAVPTAPNLVPVPCDLPTFDQASYNAPQTNNGAQYNFRLDHSMREGKDRLYASFFRFDQRSVSARIQSLFDGATPSTGYYIAGNYTHQFSSGLLNQASFGQTRFDFDYTTTDHSQQQLLTPYLYGCFCAGLNQTQFLEETFEHQTYGRDTISWVKGKHNLTFGLQGSYNNEVNDNSVVYGRPFLQASFDIYSFLNDITNLELIYTLSGQTGKFIPQRFGAGSTRFGVYAGDSWKVTPNLLVTYGLRWDDFGNPSAYGKNAEPFANVVLGNGTSLQQQVAGASSRLSSNVYSGRLNENFLPRGGFAYTMPASQGKMVVHGGIGLYEDDLNLTEVAANLPTQPPSRLSLTLSSYSSPVPVTSFGTTTTQGPPGGNPYGFRFPDITITGYSSKGAPLDTSGNVIVGDLFGVDRKLKPASALLYNFGFEQELPRQLVVGLLYAGSYGYNQLVQTDANTYAGLTGNQANTRYDTDFGKIKFFRNAGESNYNALIATARQTVGTLTYQASYTWGKSLGDPTANFTDQYNIHSQYTYQNGDTRNRFSLSEVYEVPSHFGTHWENEALGGWSLSNTIVAQTGRSFTVADTSGTYDYNQDGVFYDIPVYLGSKRNFSRSDARASAYSATPVFKGGAKAFAAPPGVTEGDRQNTFRGPGYFTLDTGLSKKIQLPWFSREKASLALRGEAINILNHANFNGPNGSFADASFGIVSGAYQGRIIQIGGRLQF